jgi:N-acetylglucosamine kinase-like BadF-type ATPase
MATVKLIADSGATKTEWCLIEGAKKRTLLTAGISPYFLSTADIVSLLQQELIPRLRKAKIQEVFYYGTGCANPNNVKIVRKALQLLFPSANIEVTHDLMGAARALCGREKGIACILGTGSNSCYFNGKKITRNSPGLGYVLGDEGSGAYLGRKVIQYYLYGIFDEELRGRSWKMFIRNHCPTATWPLLPSFLLRTEVII